VKFAWDDAKDRANQQKHGVSFAEAKTLFTSGNDFLEIYDDEHSMTEDRFIDRTDTLRHGAGGLDYAR